MTDCDCGNVLFVQHRANLIKSAVVSYEQCYFFEMPASPLMDVFSDHAPLVQSGRSRTRRNVNDISERAGSHYLRSTRQSIVGLDAGFT